MHNHLIHISAFVVIIIALAASISLSHTNAWASNSDPTAGMRITAGSPTCIINCIVIGGSTGPQGPPGPQGPEQLDYKDQWEIKETLESKDRQDQPGPQVIKS
ncbi:MAG: hypothetical protein WBQ25_23135 [Nitrososphaeraceae archaeon]